MSEFNIQCAGEGCTRSVRLNSVHLIGNDYVCKSCHKNGGISAKVISQRGTNLKKAEEKDLKFFVK